MSSTKNLTSSKRHTQSKTLTVQVIQDEKFKVRIDHNLINSAGETISRNRTYVLNKLDSYADKTLHNYLHSLDWNLNLIGDQLEVSRSYHITRLDKK